MDIPAYREKNLAKIWEENDKNCCGALLSQRERGKFEKLLKKMF